MTKPIGHTEDYVRMVIDQLRAEFPHASGEVIRAAARAKYETNLRRDLDRGSITPLRLVKG